MKNPSLRQLSSADHLSYSDEYQELTLRSPAAQVLINFKFERPQIVDAKLSAIEANRLMMKTHSDVALVTNAGGEFLGLVSSRILTERSIIRLVANGMEREDINVCEVMLPRESIHALDIDDVADSRVFDVIQILQERGEEYCLTVENSSHVICGMFGISDISRRLHTPILIRRKQTFADLVSAMAH